MAAGECDALVGGDLVVSASGPTLELMRPGRTGAVVNSHATMTGEFTRDPEFSLPAERLELSIGARLDGALRAFDATKLSRVALGDSIHSNMMLLGAAWQGGLIPVSREALLEAIRLNGASVERNLRAFEVGRWAVERPEEAAAALSADAPPPAETPQARIRLRAEHLAAYAGAALAERYLAMVEGIADPEAQDAVARGYHKLLAYKDEYEVARLLLQTREMAAREFEGDFRIAYHLAPPILGGTGPDGRPRKREFGAWIEGPLRLLARMRGLRGTWLDPFGRTAERRMERALIRQYEEDMAAALPMLGGPARPAVLALAALPLQIRGFGPVKMKSAAEAGKRREELLAAIRQGGQVVGEAAQ